MNRLLVAQAPLGHGRSGEPLRSGRDEPLPVGVVRWPRRIAVVIKLTFTYDPSALDQVAQLADAHAPLVIGDTSQAPGATEMELSHPDDFVRYKPQTDVILRGLGYADQARDVIFAAIKVDAVERSFALRGPTPIERMPLTGGYVRAADGESLTEPVTAAGPWFVNPWLKREEVERMIAEDNAQSEPAAQPSDEEDPRGAAADLLGVGADDKILASWWELESTDAEDNAEATSFASDQQRTRVGTWLGSNARFELTGLGVGGTKRVIALPGLAPWVAVESRFGDYRLDMLLDTVIVDTETSRIEVVWRGQVPLMGDHAQHEVRRIVVTVEQDDAPRPLGIVYRDLQRGRFFRATERADLSDEAADDDPLDVPGVPEIPDLELEVAKYADWMISPEPTLTLEQYTTVAGALAAGSEPRDEVLERHGLDEDAWLLEERGWLEKIGNSVMAGEFALTEQYARLFKEATDRAKGDDQT